MNKKFLVAAALSLGITALPATGIISSTTVSATSSYIKTPSAQPEYVTLGAYYVDAKTTKGLADKLEALTGGGATLTSTGASSLADYVINKKGYKFGGYVTVAALALDLSKGAQDNLEIKYAGKHNMRLKVTIEDYKNYSTSYSKRITWKAVK